MITLFNPMCGVGLLNGDWEIKRLNLSLSQSLNFFDAHYVYQRPVHYCASF